MNNIVATDLLRQPSFLKGSARIVDLFGNVNTYNYSKTEKDADAKSLAKDWSAVGNDIVSAAKNV